MSPYITECPYCGNRLRKRAPKLDRNGRITERVSRRPSAPSLPRLRRGEIPGIRHESRPYAAITLVALGFLGTLIWRLGGLDPLNLVILGHLRSQWWRPFTAPFIYDNVGYAVVALSIVALFGSLLERRHGPVVMLGLLLIGGVGGMALAGSVSSAIILGGNGAGLTLLAAWAVPDLLALLGKRDYEGDLAGTAVLGAVLALMPLVDPQASWVTAGLGVLAGLVLGYLLAKIHPA